MSLTAAVLWVLLSQAAEPAETLPEAAPAPAPAETASPPAEGAPPGEETAAPKVKAPSFAFKPGQLTNAEDIAKELEKIQALPPEQQSEKMAELLKRLPDFKGLAPAAFNGATQAHYLSLPDSDQASVAARFFFTQLIAGNARGVVEISAVPFQLEDRKYNTPEELLQVWLKSLRVKRSDLMTLYGIELLTPADMEKKYGKPPARLGNLPWRNSKTMIAVANLSGHAAIAVMRQHPSGMGWQVVGYSD